KAGGSTSFGPPIVAGGAVWAVSTGGGGLYGFDASTVAQIFHSAGFSATHFTTPSEAGNQVFVGSGTVIRSFNLLVGCQSVTATANPPSPRSVSTPVAITATASGCPSPSPLYEFWIRNPGAACCTLAQAYGTSATYNWNTTGLFGGTYTFAVWAKDANSNGLFANSLGRYDAYFVMTYTLTASPCTGVTASSAPSGTASRGTPVTITGTASGRPNARYQFEMLSPGSQTWQVVQVYSAGATFNWTTTGFAPGTYTFIVKARDQSSSGTAGSGNPNGTWDAYISIPYTLT